MNRSYCAGVILGGLTTLAVLVVDLACTPGQRQAARTVLDFAQTLCVVSHAASDDATVAQVCGITEALLPEMRKLVSAERTAAAQRVGACK